MFDFRYWVCALACCTLACGTLQVTINVTF